MTRGVAILLFLAVADLAHSFPAGEIPLEKKKHPDIPSADICDSMAVGHGSPPMTTPSPYTIELSDEKVAPGGTITVTIGSKDGQVPFKGLIVQGRCGNEPVGSFVGSGENVAEGTNYSNCGDGEKNSLVFITMEGEIYKAEYKWQAPSTALECPIQFVVSTVKSYREYWKQQKSEQTLKIA